MRVIFRTALLLYILIPVTILLAGCQSSGSGGYIEKNLRTTNGEDGWICTFDTLNGEYTNAFAINSNKIRITAHVDEGSMRVILRANGEREEYDVSDSEITVPVDKFGENNLYITFDGDDARNGSIRVIWIDDGSADEQHDE